MFKMADTENVPSKVVPSDNILHHESVSKNSKNMNTGIGFCCVCYRKLNKQLRFQCNKCKMWCHHRCTDITSKADYSEDWCCLHCNKALLILSPVLANPVLSHSLSSFSLCDLGNKGEHSESLIVSSPANTCNVVDRRVADESAISSTQLSGISKSSLLWDSCSIYDHRWFGNECSDFSRPNVGLDLNLDLDEPNLIVGEHYEHTELLEENTKLRKEIQGIKNYRCKFNLLKLDVENLEHNNELLRKEVTIAKTVNESLNEDLQQLRDKNQYLVKKNAALLSQLISLRKIKVNKNISVDNLRGTFIAKLFNATQFIGSIQSTNSSNSAINPNFQVDYTLENTFLINLNDFCKLEPSKRTLRRKNSRRLRKEKAFSECNDAIESSIINVASPPTITVNSDTPENSRTKITADVPNPDKPKVIIFSDSHGWGLGTLLRGKLPNYHIECHVKSGAPLQEVCKSSKDTAEKLRSKDILVILAGTNNFEHAGDFSNGELCNRFFAATKELMTLTSRTNVIFLSLPQRWDLRCGPGLVENINTSLHNIVKEYDNCKFLDLSDIGQNLYARRGFGIHLSSHGKSKLAEKLIQSISLSFSSPANASSVSHATDGTDSILTYKIDVIVSDRNRNINNKNNIKLKHKPVEERIFGSGSLNWRKMTRLR